jgi:hypothetical protein
LASLRASPSDTSKISEKKTEVLYGEEKTTEVMVHSFDHAVVGCDVCGNWAAPSIILGMDPLRNAVVRAKRRGIRLRYITDITNDNVSYCKELCKIVELRHFDGLKGNFVVIDGKEYLAIANLQEFKPLPHLIYSKSQKSLCSSSTSLIHCGIRQFPAILKLSR